MSETAPAIGGNYDVPERSSWSQLSTYEQCGEAFRLKYVGPDRLPRIPQGGLVSGIAGHETIRRSEAEGWWQEPLPKPKDPALPRHPLIAGFRAELLDRVAKAGYNDAVRWSGRRSRNYPNGEDGVWWFEFGGPRCMRRYQYVRGLDHLSGVQFYKGGVEMRVAMDMPSGRQVVGYIDVFVLVDADGEPFIRDWKLGRPGGGSSVQPAVYARAIEQALGITVRKAQIVYLKSTKDESLFSWIDVEPLMPLVERKFNDFERGLEAGIFPLKEGPLCKGCAVRVYCPYGKTLGTDDLPEPWRSQ